MQRQILEEEDPRCDAQQAQKKGDTANAVNDQKNTSVPEKSRPLKIQQKKKPDEKEASQPSQQSVPNNLPEPEQMIPPIPDLDDGETDRL